MNSIKLRFENGCLFRNYENSKPVNLTDYYSIFQIKKKIKNVALLNLGIYYT